MNPKACLTVGVIAASFAVPASASAATASASASASVRADAKASVQAFEKVKVLSEAGRDAAAVAKLRVGLRELRAAAGMTARMRLKADTGAELKRVVQAEREIGHSAKVGAGVLADVVADVNVSAQVKMAAAISSLLKIHQQALGALGATVELASDSVDALAVKAIVELGADANAIVSAISDTLASTDVSVKTAVALKVALSLATETVSSSLAMLQSISVNATTAAQASISVAISQLTEALVQTQATLQALARTVATIGTDTAGSIVLPTLNSLLGSVNVALSANAQAQLGAGVSAR